MLSCRISLHLPTRAVIASEINLTSVFGKFGNYFNLPEQTPVVNNPPAKAREVRDSGWIPGWGSSPRGGRGKPLQCSCLEKPMDQGAWQATVLGLQTVRHGWRGLAHMHSHKPGKKLTLPFVASHFTFAVLAWLEHFNLSLEFSPTGHHLFSLEQKIVLFYSRKIPPDSSTFCLRRKLLQTLPSLSLSVVLARTWWNSVT